MGENVKPVPDGLHTLTPHIVCAGAAEVIDFYKKALGATEFMRMPRPDGKLTHASVKIGDSMLMLVDEMPQWGALGPKARNGISVTIHLAVANEHQFRRGESDEQNDIREPTGHRPQGVHGFLRIHRFQEQSSVHRRNGCVHGVE